MFCSPIRQKIVCLYPPKFMMTFLVVDSKFLTFPLSPQNLCIPPHIPPTLLLLFLRLFRVTLPVVEHVVLFLFLAHTFMHNYIQEYTHTYIIACIHTYIHACMHTYIHAYIKHVYLCPHISRPYWYIQA